MRELLAAIGEDTTRPALRETPARVARFYRELIEWEPGNCDTLFESAKTDQLVVVSGMRVWSLCEHHLLPFWCDVSVGYIALGKVLGLSKFARIAQQHAHGLQIQERLVTEIAASVMRLVGHKNVAVIAKGEHLCMTMRGIKTRGLMSSSAVHGAFRRAEVRAEFLRLALG